MTWARLREALSSAATAWQLAAALLEAWQADRPADPAWSQGHGDRWDAWARVQGEVWEVAEQWTTHHLRDDDLERVLGLVEAGWDVLGVDALHAAAWGIDEGAHTLFAGDWLPGDEPFSLAAGRPFYVGEPDPHDYAPASELRRTSRPSSTTEPRLGELPHVRRHDGGGIDVVVDPRWRVELERIACGTEPIVAAHPNATLAEFDQPRVGAAVFPVTVRDLNSQGERFDELLKRATAPSVDARVVVFPELTSTPELVDRVKAQIDAAPGSRLVVAGSYHHLQGEDGANTAAGVITRSDARLQHDKLAAFVNRDGSKEGIRRSGQVTVYEAGQFRVAIAICKDLLDDEVRRVYQRCGVNVLLVPAMSEKTAEFVTAIRGLVKSNQAVTLFTNALLHHAGGAPISPAAALGQPFDGAEVIATEPEPSGAPTLTVFKVGEPGPIH